MTLVFVVLPLALVLVMVALGAFIWATRSGQFDDLDTPQLRMLHDDDDLGPSSRPRETSAPADPSGKEPPR
jgi:cbb3-type cytochrome oxidase maturation protein